uniref:Uncharacterized protein n=1 Tax=Kalanchoe fedtschenkoi TaxID=63787 RepID=A0A7N0TH34_KALFE
MKDLKFFCPLLSSLNGTHKQCLFFLLNHPLHSSSHSVAVLYRSHRTVVTSSTESAYLLPPYQLLSANCTIAPFRPPILSHRITLQSAQFGSHWNLLI